MSETSESELVASSGSSEESSTVNDINLGIDIDQSEVSKFYF